MGDLPLAASASASASSGITSGLGSGLNPNDILEQSRSQANEVIAFQKGMSDLNRDFQMNRAFFQFKDAMNQAFAGIMQSQSQQLGRAG